MSFVSWFNNPSPTAAYMRQWIRLALVRMMACRLFAPGLCLGQCWVIVNWNRFQFVSCFNHLPLVPHICVSESGQHWFGWWLVAYSAPGLCLGQCWVTVNWNRLQFVFCFNHLLLVSHICVSESGQHLFGWWLVAYSAPSHCSGQCWVIVNWNRLQWNFNLNANLFISENASEDIVCEIVAFCPGGDELNHTQMIILHLKTHWGRVTHICVVNLTSIGPYNGLSPGRRQAIASTNAGIL